jgi:hypothetical protein
MSICRISPGDDEDEIEGDWNEEQGVQGCEDRGRSLICKVVPSGDHYNAVEGTVSQVTSVMGDASIGALITEVEVDNE